MINEAFELVKTYHKAAGLPFSPYPQTLGPDRVKSRSARLQDGTAQFSASADLMDQAKSLTNLLYQVLGAYAEMGLSPDELFSLIHQTHLDEVLKNPESRTLPDDQIRKIVNEQIALKKQF